MSKIEEVDHRGDEGGAGCITLMFTLEGSKTPVLVLSKPTMYRQAEDVDVKEDLGNSEPSPHQEVHKVPRRRVRKKSTSSVEPNFEKDQGGGEGEPVDGLSIEAGVSTCDCSLSMSTATTWQTSASIATPHSSCSSSSSFAFSCDSSSPFASRHRRRDRLAKTLKVGMVGFAGAAMMSISPTTGAAAVLELADSSSSSSDAGSVTACGVSMRAGVKNRGAGLLPNVGRGRRNFSLSYGSTSLSYAHRRSSYGRKSSSIWHDSESTRHWGDERSRNIAGESIPALSEWFYTKSVAPQYGAISERTSTVVTLFLQRLHKAAAAATTGEFWSEASKVIKSLPMTAEALTSYDLRIICYTLDCFNEYMAVKAQSRTPLEFVEDELLSDIESADAALNRTPLGFDLPMQRRTNLNVDHVDIKCTHKGYPNVVQGTWRVGQYIAAGSAGGVFFAYDPAEHHLACCKIAKPGKNKRMIDEANNLDTLGNMPGIPRLISSGRELGREVVVQETLGPNLEELRDLCGGTFSMKTVLMLADQMLQRLEQMHARHLVHRDLSARNMCMGARNAAGRVYVIDFDLARNYRDPKTLVVAPYIECKGFSGTKTTMPLSALLASSVGPKDDLESLGISLLYWLKGIHPSWRRATKKKNKEIGIHGKSDPAKGQFALTHQGDRSWDMFCEERLASDFVKYYCADLPQEFREYFNHLASLDYSQPVDYEYLRSIFRNLYDALGYAYDGMFDWDHLMERR